MFSTTIIKKYITGKMQEAGGFCEPVTRAFGLRVRTLGGNTLTLSHNDDEGHIQTNTGTLRLTALASIKTVRPFYAGSLVSEGEIYAVGSVRAGAGVFDGDVRIPAPSTGTTAARPIEPLLAHEFFDTDLDAWIKWNGSEWRYLTEALVE